MRVVSKIKNESYQIIWDMGGTDPDYFEKRDINIKRLLNEKNITEDFMDIFYEKYLPKYYEMLLKIILTKEIWN